MDTMGQPPAHAKPLPKRDHLWVLVLIACCCLIKVWPSWVGIGAEAGFPKLGKMATDWTLAVVIEAYWGYAVYAWLAASAGRRSGRFAMSSAAAVFALSLLGQSAERLVPAPVMTAFANALPVIVLALIAVLVHLRQKDREEAAAADERTALRAGLDTAQAERDEAHADLATTRTELARMTARAEVLERKAAAQKPKRPRTQAPAARRAKAPGAAPHAAPKTDDRTMLPDDFDARTQALEVWLANPQISGKDLAAEVGMKERWGQLRKAEFAASVPTGQDPRERP